MAFTWSMHYCLAAISCVSSFFMLWNDFSCASACFAFDYETSLVAPSLFSMSLRIACRWLIPSLRFMTCC